MVKIRREKEWFICSRSMGRGKSRARRKLADFLRENLSEIPLVECNEKTRVQVQGAFRDSLFHRLGRPLSSKVATVVESGSLSEQECKCLCLGKLYATKSHENRSDQYESDLDSLYALTTQGSLGLSSKIPNLQFLCINTVAATLLSLQADELQALSNYFDGMESGANIKKTLSACSSFHGTINQNNLSLINNPSVDKLVLSCDSILNLAPLIPVLECKGASRFQESVQEKRNEKHLAPCNQTSYDDGAYVDIDDWAVDFEVHGAHSLQELVLIRPNPNIVFGIGSMLNSAFIGLRTLVLFDAVFWKGGNRMEIDLRDWFISLLGGNLNRLELWHCRMCESEAFSEALCEVLTDEATRNALDNQNKANQTDNTLHSTKKMHIIIRGISDNHSSRLRRSWADAVNSISQLSTNLRVNVY